jgi:cation diffusion facilitator CzcD-associated flavoprotein CzcO
MSPAAISGPTAPVETRRADLCIVGAGLCGLNALFVASQYLSRDQKVILIDRRARVGGMWVDTYPYVRLHQPYGLFTAGNIPWTLDRDPSYLATKGEVLAHFDHCLAVIKRRVQVEVLFGWTVDSHREADGVVRISARSADGQQIAVEAPQLILASGVEVLPNEPLEVSSDQVRSVSPDFCDVREGEMRRTDTPVWIVGGGKTAMDTAHAVITGYPGREVNVIAGSGTLFSCRDKFFPAGARRWWTGKLTSGVAMEVAHRFDGTNEIDVERWIRERYGTWLTPQTGNYLLGLLSKSEAATIAAGLNDVVMDHFTDAVDRPDGVDLVLRSGARKAVTPGSWIVNCTGYLLRNDRPYQPYISDTGAVLSVGMRSATMHLPSYVAYFMTHLLYLQKARQIPLYELDMQELRRKSTAVLPYAMFSLAQHNLSLIADAVPNKVFSECGLDFDRWYPLHRRLAGNVRFMATHHRERVTTGKPWTPCGTASVSAAGRWCPRPDYSQSVQIIRAASASRLRWCTRKQLRHVNSSACLGITRTVSSSSERSAPGSSKESAASASSTSITAVVGSLRRPASSSRDSSSGSTWVRRGAS